MKNIKDYNLNELEKESTLLNVKKIADYALRYENGMPGNETVEINKIRLNLKEKLRKGYGQVKKDYYKQYQLHLVEMSYVLLLLLGRIEVLDLFKKHFLKVMIIGLANNIKVDDKLKSYVFTINNDAEKQRFVDDIRENIKENNEILGNKRINVNGESSKSTIKNWLKDYDKVVGAGEHGELDISNYLFKTENAKILNSDDKNILKEILRLYERLKLDMMHPNGIATYPLYFFGIREVGKGLDKKYLPKDPKEYKTEMEKRKKTREEKKKAVKSGISDQNLMPRKSDLAPTNDQVQATKASRQNLPQSEPRTQLPEQELLSKKSAFEKKKEEKFAGLKSVPKISIAKLSSATSLQKLKIEDFRSYGKDAKSSGAYMANKIKKLIENSPENKEAIKHYLRRSELYKTYLEQGKESLDTKKDLAEIAHNRKNKGEKYITKEEFEELKKVLKAI